MGHSCSPVDNSGEGVAQDTVSITGSVNKRKFVSDASQDNRSGLSMEAFFSDLPDYDTVEELQSALKESSSNAIEEQEVVEVLKAEWEDSVVLEFQELMITNLEAVFKEAVKRIVESGYTAEVAEWAILNSGLFHGSKDAVSNVVDGALALLKGEKEINTSLKYSVFKDLKYLAAYTMLEMIHVLQEVRPTFTLAEAMFSLLISDLNLLNACVVDQQDTTEDSAKPLQPNPESPETAKSVSKDEKRSQPDTSSRPTNQQASSKARPDEMTATIQESCVSFQHGRGKFSGHVQISTQSAFVDEKLGGFKKGPPSTSSKRDMLRQKAFQMEKNCKGRISKAAFKAKVAAWGSMVIDKSQKSDSASSLVMKGPQAESSSESKSGVPAQLFHDLASAPSSNRPASSAPAQNPSPKEEKTPNPPKVVDYTLCVPKDETDETVLLLVSHKKALDKEIQGWNGWAMEKVKQAANRLNKDKVELKTLKQERDELEKMEKERQTLEETTMKRLAEMEYALSNANGQIEVSTSTHRRLEEENMLLKVEQKEVELRAVRCQRSYDEALAKEQEAEKAALAVDKEKRSLMDQLKIPRQQADKLQKQVEKGKERVDQFMVLFKHEEKERLKFAAQMDALKAKREQEDEAVEEEAENIRQAAEVEFQKCKKSIQDLEKVISEKKLEATRSRIAALNIGYGGSSSLTGTGTSLPKITKRLPAFQDNFGGREDVKPERECAMCLTEEFCVFFLPCRHQVLCAECSEIHEKQGMTDCPSCRTTIHRRIRAHFKG